MTTEPDLATRLAKAERRIAKLERQVATIASIGMYQDAIDRAEEQHLAPIKERDAENRRRLSGGA